MFTRTHQIGQHRYTEVLESYRDPETSRPKHRCIGRWRAERTFAQELGTTLWDIASLQRSTARYQGILDRTIAPRSYKDFGRASSNLPDTLARLAKQEQRLAVLNAIRDKGLAVDDAEVRQAFDAAEARHRRFVSSFASGPPAPKPEEVLRQAWAACSKEEQTRFLQELSPSERPTVV